jgi:quinol monooxygenase YgiN
VAGRIAETFALVVRFEVLEGQEDGFDSLVAETMDGIRAHEPGTLAYIVHQEPSAPRARVFYELYRDVEAFEEHERQPHVRHFLAERTQYLAADPLVWRLEATAAVADSDLDDLSDW